MRKLAILLGGALVVAACQTTPPPPPPPPPAPDLNNLLLAPGFLAHAASGDQFEIQSSQAAQRLSTVQAVRDFAGMMITDHTRLSQAMAAAAQSAGVTPPAPTMLPAEQAMWDQLRACGTGVTCDPAYKNAQITAHQNALQLFQNYAANGDVPAIKAAAAQAIPTIQMHLQAAQMLQIAPPPPPPAPPPPRKAGERG
jgi:putative membrane protein